MTDTKMQAVPTDDWNSSISHIIADMKGQPLNVHNLLANNPALLDAWWSLRNYLVQGGSLGKRNAELVILRTAAHARNWYEWASHVERGLNSDLSLAEIERVLEGPNHPDWTESDALLLQSVDDLALNGALGPGLLEKLDAHIGQEAVLDLIALRSMYIMLGNMLNTWEVELDKHVANALPASMTRESFKGRR